MIVRPNHEHTAEKALCNRGFEAYLPAQKVKRRWSTGPRNWNPFLVPGYLFCRFETADRMRFSTLRESFRSRDRARLRCLWKTKKSQHPYADFFAARAGVVAVVRVGERVRIEYGALQGLSGVIVRARDAWRVVVSIERRTAPWPWKWMPKI